MEPPGGVAEMMRADWGFWMFLLGECFFLFFPALLGLFFSGGVFTSCCFFFFLCVCFLFLYILLAAWLVYGLVLCFVVSHKIC